MILCPRCKLFSNFRFWDFQKEEEERKRHKVVPFGGLGHGTQKIRVKPS
jgi:hypothetical protein